MTGRERRARPGPVELQDATGGRWLAARPLERLASVVLELTDAGGAGLSLRIVEDPEMRRLNRQYLGRDRTTNVLSFPQQADASGVAWLGDVVLAPATIARRAQATGRDPAADVAHLLVHGVLHLEGYDHVGARAERERMRAEERRVLAELARRRLGVELRCPAT